MSTHQGRGTMHDLFSEVFLQTQTQVYLKTVAERLKRYNVVQGQKNFKNTVKRTQ